MCSGGVWDDLRVFAACFACVLFFCKCVVVP